MADKSLEISFWQDVLDDPLSAFMNSSFDPVEDPELTNIAREINELLFLAQDLASQKLKELNEE